MGSRLLQACLRVAGVALKYWHLFSLDAPTVAVVWCGAFARAAHIRLPLLSYGLLFVATWGLYAADRLLDSMQVAHAEALRDRHYFHARHRRFFLSIGIPSAVALVWLVATRMNPTARLNDLLLSAAAGAYLLAVHLPMRGAMRRKGPSSTHRLFLPKELSVAIIFASACVIPAWSQPSTPHVWLFGAGILFSLLCWLNCIAIEIWEARDGATVLPLLTQTIGQQLRIACLIVATAGVCAAVVAALVAQPAFCVPALSVTTSALLLRLLDRRRLRLAPLQLRAAADLVLLTPAAFLLLAALPLRLR